MKDPLRSFATSAVTLYPDVARFDLEYCASSRLALQSERRPVIRSLPAFLAPERDLRFAQRRRGREPAWRRPDRVHGRDPAPPQATIRAREREPAQNSNSHSSDEPATPIAYEP